MADRKNYSKLREQKIYAIIHEELMQVCMDMLRGGYCELNRNGKEARFAKFTVYLGDKVCAEYRKSYAPIHKPKKR